MPSDRLPHAYLIILNHLLLLVVNQISKFSLSSFQSIRLGYSLVLVTIVIRVIVDMLQELLIQNRIRLNKPQHILGR
jgi:hypothetical protein